MRDKQHQLNYPKNGEYWELVQDCEIVRFNPSDYISTDQITQLI